MPKNFRQNLGLTSSNLPDEILNKIGDEIVDEQQLMDLLDDDVEDCILFNRKVKLLICSTLFLLMIKIFYHRL